MNALVVHEREWSAPYVAEKREWSAPYIAEERDGVVDERIGS